MPSYNPPLVNQQFIFSVGLFTVIDDLLVSPDIQSGDFQVSKDFGAFQNLTNLPTVAPTNSGQVRIILTDTEMDADIVTVRWVSQGNDWKSGMMVIHTATKQFGDIPDLQGTISAVWNEQISEPVQAFDWNTATPREMLAWITALSKNKIVQTAQQSALRNETDTADIARSAILETQGQFIRGKWTST